MTITEFLEARVAEDEAAARAAAESPAGAGAHWFNSFRQIEGTAHSQVADSESSWYADHISRNDPARVMAECAAKRAIIGEHELASDICVACEREHPCPTLKIIAAVYADHPDYQEKWDGDTPTLQRPEHP